MVQTNAINRTACHATFSGLFIMVESRLVEFRIDIANEIGLVAGSGVLFILRQMLADTTRRSIEREYSTHMMK